MKRKLVAVGCLVCLIGIGFTAISILDAMYAYSGGTILDRSSLGYDWWNNYLSDLGRIRAWNQELNDQSNLYFNQGLYVAIVAMIIMFNLYHFIARSKLEKRLSFLAGLLGIGAAMAYVGIVWFPLDVNYRLHTIFVRVGFISFWILSLALATLIQKLNDFPSIYAWVMYGFAMTFLVQIGIMLLGPRAWTSPEALMLQVTAQKMIVGLQLIVMGIQALGLFFYCLQFKNEKV